MTAAHAHLPANTPWTVQIVALVLNAKIEKVYALLLLASVGMLIYHTVYYRPMVDNKMISILSQIAIHESVQTCILTGGMDGGCKPQRVLSGIGDGLDPTMISDAFFSGTIGGEGSKTP